MGNGGSGGFQVDIGALQSAAQGLRQSAADLQGMLKIISSNQLDLPELAFTQTDLLEMNPSASKAYAQARGDAESFLRQMIVRLLNVCAGLDTVAQYYQSTETANTAAARSAQP